ncbi:MAG: hypothetical protein LAP85_09530 [Acidobacteriia bacterium]|nr:hypothetical protein [Terriglobia bacterium]
MPKQFYTEKDIEDMFKGGIMSLALNDDVVLTEMAYEKAGSVGMKLVRDKPENPPSAPVRPYISQKRGQSPTTLVAAAAVSPLPSPGGGHAAGAPAQIELQQRIRDAVTTRLGAQVDSTLLDVIIKRVLISSGVK